MQQALRLAQTAAKRQEVPIAALVVQNGKIVARAYNRRETTSDATAHAEMLAIRKACRKLKDWRLAGTTLYVTMEPCLMCYGAAVQARIDRIVYACVNHKNPQYLRQVYARWPRGPQLTGNVEAPAAIAILSLFFKRLRR